MKKQLQNVTLLGVDCVDIERLILASEIRQKDFGFAGVKLLTSIQSDKVCAYSHTLGVSTFASEPRTFSARASLTKGRVPPSNEVDGIRSESDTANSRMKTRMGVVRVEDSVGTPNKARISMLNSKP